MSVSAYGVGDSMRAIRKPNGGKLDFRFCGLAEIGPRRVDIEIEGSGGENTASHAGETGDHGGIVSAVFGESKEEPDPAFGAGLRKERTEAAIERDAAADSEIFLVAECLFDASDDGADNGLLIVGDELGDFVIVFRRIGLNDAEKCGFESAEAQAEIRTKSPGFGVFADSAFGENALMRGFRFCEFIDDRSAGIAETEQLCGLVERFSGGIVDGPSDEGDFSGGRHSVEAGMATGDGQAQTRIGCRRIRRIGMEKDGMEMCLHVVDGAQRFSGLQGETLCEGPTDEQGGGETGSTRCGDFIDLVPCETCFLHGAFHDIGKEPDMATGCDFRDDAAERAVLRLGMDNA